jgi:hypothetical protein
MILEILKYTIPALIVFATAYFTIKQLISNEDKRRKIEAILNNQKMITPIRLKSYERMILMLERISPQSLVLRTQNNGMSNQDLQGALLKNIRSEFEHNMAHQLYISDKAWELIKTSKENLLKLINQNAISLKPDGPAIQLSKYILEKMLDSDKDPTKKAILHLKSEIRELF